jgi:hypothetical protein
MMAVSIAPTEGGVEAGTPRLLFEGRFAVSGLPGDDAWYDVGPDGQRFLMIRAEEATTTIVMVQEWLTELKHLVPTKWANYWSATREIDNEESPRDERCPVAD